jgi:hypothetical protein
MSVVYTFTGGGNEELIGASGRVDSVLERLRITFTAPTVIREMCVVFDGILDAGDDISARALIRGGNEF